MKLRDKDGIATTDREKIIEITEEYYLSSYTPEREDRDVEKVVLKRITNVNSKDVAVITISEMKSALIEMKNGRAAGDDGVIIELIKESGDEFLVKLCLLFNRCLDKGKIPEGWRNSLIILIYKKGGTTQLKN